MGALLLLLSPALAAQLRMEVAQRELQVGQTVGVELNLVDGVTRQVPDIPAGQGLELSFQGQSQSMVMVNFKSTRTITYSYALTATAPGTWTVGPVALTVDGKDLVAPPVQVHVAPRSEAARAERDVHAELSDTDPYLGQVVVYRFRFQHKGEVLDARWTPPSYDGFVREQVADIAQQELSTALDGVPYTIEEIDVPLVAAGQGTRSIGPSMLTAKVPVERADRRRRGRDPFVDSPFRTYTEATTETITADPVPVSIRPLPTEGKPADYSGLVGHFTLSVTPSASAVKLGDSLTLDVSITGDGTLSGFRLPPPPSGSGYRAYDDEPTLEASIKDGQFLSRATFRRAVVPEAEGELHLPPLRVPVFDPQTGAYVVLESEPVSVTVTPGEAGAGQVTSFAAAGPKKGVESLGEDILAPPGDATIADRTLAGTWPFAVVPPILPLVGWAGLALSQAIRRRSAAPSAQLRAALQRLPTDPPARLAALEQLFRDAAGLRLGRPSAGLERATVAPLGPDADAIYADLDRARYGGADVADLEARIRTFVEATP